MGWEVRVSLTNGHCSVQEEAAGEEKCKVFLRMGIISGILVERGMKNTITWS